MIKITHNEFKHHLKQLQDDKQSGLTGPFIHSAPVGNMFRGPFKERTWMAGKEVVLKDTWAPEVGWKFFTAKGRKLCTM